MEGIFEVFDEWRLILCIVMGCFVDRRRVLLQIRCSWSGGASVLLEVLVS